MLKSDDCTVGCGGRNSQLVRRDGREPKKEQRTRIEENKKKTERRKPGGKEPLRKQGVWVVSDARCL